MGNGKIKHKIITFKNKERLLKFYRELPTGLQSQCGLFESCNILSLPEKAYASLHIKVQQLPQESYHVEDNRVVKLHKGTENIPWGISFVQAPRAWRHTQGRNIKVGIIDTGIDANHSDLTGNVVGGTNPIDNTSPYSDVNGHGTHVAGIIAAQLNGVGIVGTAPRASLYAIKVFSDDGLSTTQDIIAGIEWAIRNGMQILNMSFGTEEYSAAMKQAIKVANQAGIIMVASAGNDGGSPTYPAKYKEVIGVGALNRQGKVPTFSSRGVGLDYVKPGVDIYSTYPNNSYMNLSGTSMAAPHLVGVVALLKGYYPKLTPTAVKTILKSSACTIPNVKKSAQGKGVIKMSRLGQLVYKYQRLLKKYR